jgi:hypothetical protein
MQACKSSHKVSSGTSRKRLVIVRDGVIVYECRGCGRPIEPGEAYVVALEYERESDFTLHMKGGDVAVGTEQRFHVEHFRGRLDDYFYELVDKRDSL